MKKGQTTTKGGDSKATPENTPPTGSSMTKEGRAQSDSANGVAKTHQNKTKGRKKTKGGQGVQTISSDKPITEKATQQPGQTVRRGNRKERAQNPLDRRRRTSLLQKGFDSRGVQKPKTRITSPQSLTGRLKNMNLMPSLRRGREPGAPGARMSVKATDVCFAM